MAHGQAAAGDHAGEHQVDDVAAAGLDRLTDDDQPAHVHRIAGLLGELASGRVHQGLAHLDAAAGQ